MSDIKKPIETGLLHPDPADPIVLDPHGKAADHTLRPDPTGSRDPIGRPGSDAPASKAGDASEAGGLARAAKDKVGAAADRAADLGRQGRDRASDLADEARDRASDAYDGARTWASGLHQEHMRRIDDAVVRGSEGLNRGRTAVERFVTENPLLVGVVGVAAGLLLGALIPRTRQEDRNIGPYADEMRDQGLRYAREFTSRGREFVETALDPDNLNAAAEKVAAKAEPGYQGDDKAAHRL